MTNQTPAHSCRANNLSAFFRWGRHWKPWGVLIGLGGGEFVATFLIGPFGWGGPGLGKAGYPEQGDEAS